MIGKRTNGLVHALHAKVFIQLHTCISHAWQAGDLKFLFELGDITHAFLEFERGERGKRKADNDDGAREGIGEIDTFGELGSNDGEEEGTTFSVRGC